MQSPTDFFGWMRLLTPRSGHVWIRACCHREPEGCRALLAQSLRRRTRSRGLIVTGVVLPKGIVPAFPAGRMT